MTQRGGVKPVLVNFYEKATDRLLTSAAADNGDRLLTKVRLADVVDIDVFSGHAKGYGLKAHLDFVMVDAKSSVPRFAVELDGRQHWADPRVRERDRLKDSICEESGLPLLRITSEFTRVTGRWQVLSYIVQAFYLSEAFHTAQEQGTVPLDEPFDIGNFITKDDAGRYLFNTLDAPARLQMLNHWKNKRLPSFAPDEFLTVLPNERQVQAHAWLAVATDRYLIGRVRIRDFRFQGIAAAEIASQLAVAEVGNLADRWVAGEGVACDGRELAKNMSEVQQAIDAGGFLSVASAGALRAGGTLPDAVQVAMGAKAIAAL